MTQPGTPPEPDATAPSGGPPAPDRYGRFFAAWVAACERSGGRLALALSLLTLGAVWLAASTLGIDTDNERILAEDLPSQRAAREFERHFPALTNTLLLVVDADTAATARAAADALAERLESERDVFHEVSIPTGDPFFERHGLLYRTPEELEALGDSLARMQPILASLARDPSLETLSELLERGLERVAEEGDAGRERLRGLLEGMRRAAVTVDAEHALTTTWEDLMLEGSAFDPRTRRVVLAEPVLDFERLLAAEPAIERVRAVVAELDLEASEGVRVRITGYPALNFEEMRALLVDVGFAGLFSFVLVLLVLRSAFRAAALAAAAGVTLISGLIWTGAFAGLAVGNLNLVSVTFAVLFIGLGVDFALHLGLHYVAARERRSPAQALYAAAQEVGSPLILCTLSTAIGFFAFLPTDYRGVAQLGLIAGTGMFVILFLTATLFPALLGAGWRPARARLGSRGAEALRTRAIGFAERRPRPVVAGFLLLGVVALFFAPRARFDSNVVGLRDPDTESVQAFEDLLADDELSPWHADVLAPSLAEAEQRARALAALPEVARSITLADYVPDGQEEKREILADAALVLGGPLSAVARGAPPPAAQRLAGLRALAAALADAEREVAGSKLGASAALLRAEIERRMARIEASPDPDRELALFEHALLGDFPERLARLERALAPPEVALADLPPRLVRQMRAGPDGPFRIQVFPVEDVRDPAALTGFVAAVRAIEPGAAGLPVSVVEFGREVARSMRQALLAAALAIAALMLLVWRRPAAVALALAPLALAAVGTAGSWVALGGDFNFANVIVLPLLLGVGVDSGIHLVARAQMLGSREHGLAESATTRAVFYSALTTLASFGSLAFSGHRGVASLGSLLVVGMLWTLAANLLFLPALLAWRRRAEPAPAA